MPKSKFLKIFAMLEMLSATVFLALALIFYLSKESLGGDIKIAVVFGFIGICSLIAVPVLLKLANKKSQTEIQNSPDKFN